MTGHDQRRRAPDGRQAPRLCVLHAAALLLSMCALAPAAAQSPTPPGAQPLRATPVFEAARASLVQIRTLLSTSGQQSTIGSGFVVDAERGLVMTNYHVVSLAAREPRTYRLEFVDAGARSGSLDIIALDVANDLAVVRLDAATLPPLGFAPDAALAQGERLFALGNPLDLGFTIVEGTYNGRVERSLQQRMHFTGAINPGMSGGPTVDPQGLVVGINVSKRLDGELVSFLVPAAPAEVLLARAQALQDAPPVDFEAVIAEQLRTRQQTVGALFTDAGFDRVAAGPFLGPEPLAPWFECWSSTNADQQPAPRVRSDRTVCESDSRIFVSGEVEVGTIRVTRTLLRNDALNAFQFATAVSAHHSPSDARAPWRDNQTAPHCRDRFVQVDDRTPVLRATWCASAYRDYEGLYDIQVQLATQADSDAALLAAVTLEGFDFDTGVRVVEQLAEAVSWAP